MHSYDLLLPNSFMTVIWTTYMSDGRKYRKGEIFQDTTNYCEEPRLLSSSTLKARKLLESHCEHVTDREGYHCMQ
jgi:hypothetical protein